MPYCANSMAWESQPFQILKGKGHSFEHTRENKRDESKVTVKGNEAGEGR